MVDFLPFPAKKSQFEIIAGVKKGKKWYPDPWAGFSGETKWLAHENGHELYMPCKGNKEVPVSGDILWSQEMQVESSSRSPSMSAVGNNISYQVYNVLWFKPSCQLSTRQPLALSQLKTGQSGLMTYGADVLENWSNIPSVTEVHLAGIFESFKSIYWVFGE